MEEITQQVTQPFDPSTFVKDIAQLNLEYLGIAVTIALGAFALLGGIFYLFNVKPLKDSLDRQERLVRESEANNNKRFDSLKSETVQTIEEFKGEQAQGVKDVLAKNSENIDLETKTKLANYEGVLSKLVESVSEQKDIKLKEVISVDTDAKLLRLDKAITTTVAGSTEAINKQLSLLSSKIDRLSLKVDEQEEDIIELQVFKYDKEGKMGSIIGSVELLKRAVDKKQSDWQISRRLKTLAEQIKGIILDADIITDIEKQLQKLDSRKEFTPLITLVRQNLTVNPVSTESDKK